MNRKIVGITLGDPSGIGPEIILKALTQHRSSFPSIIPVVFAPASVLRFYARLLAIDVDIRPVLHFSQVVKPNDHTIYCFEEGLEHFDPNPGKISARNGKLSYEIMKQAIKAAMHKQIQAIVTAPIHKVALKRAGITEQDHTAILARFTHSKDPLTLFMTGRLRIFFYTRHIPFRSIADHLNQRELIRFTERCVSALQRIGLEGGQLALAALNPHAGDGGLFGDEETEILIPAVRLLRKKGIPIEGPIAADSVFHLAKEGIYDAVISLYHDQGHIAAKTYDFYKTVSLTLGLPFLRTSVDHGTALNIAGKNKANEISMVEAIKAADRYAW